MRSQFPDLQPCVKKLRHYVPKFQDEKKGSDDLGGCSTVFFGRSSVRVAVGKQEKLLELVVNVQHASIKLESQQAISRLREAMQKKGLYSPFIQKLLYQGDKGKVSEKAECDLADVMNEGIMKFGYRIKHEIDPKELVAQLILAVHELHTHGLVHRDIKMENILVTLNKDGYIHLELADLDTIVLAKSKGVMSRVGTPELLAPEICLNFQDAPSKRRVGFDHLGRINKKAIDCYALGVTLQEMIDYFHSKDALLIQMAASLVELNPKKRMTINQAINHPCFGATQEERERYFCSINKKFARPDAYYDSYYQAPHDYYPEKNDAFLLLPEHLKEIYQLGAALDDSLKIGEQSPHPLVSQSIYTKAVKLGELIDWCEQKKLEAPREILQSLKKGVSDVKIMFMTPEKLRSGLVEAIQDYDKINKISEENRTSFWCAHGMKGLNRAREFLLEIDALLLQNKPIEVLIEKVKHYLLHADGNWAETSFKTILVKKLDEALKHAFDEHGRNIKYIPVAFDF